MASSYRVIAPDRYEVTIQTAFEKPIQFSDPILTEKVQQMVEVCKSFSGISEGLALLIKKAKALTILTPEQQKKLKEILDKQPPLAVIERISFHKEGLDSVFENVVLRHKELEQFEEALLTYIETVVLPPVVALVTYGLTGSFGREERKSPSSSGNYVGSESKVEVLGSQRAPG